MNPENDGIKAASISIIFIVVLFATFICKYQFGQRTAPQVLTATPASVSEFTRGYLVGKSIYLLGCTADVECAYGKTKIYLVNFDQKDARYAWFDAPVEFLDFPSWSFCDMDKITCIAPIMEFNSPPILHK